MGFTVEQKSKEKHVPKKCTNPMKKNDLRIDKSDFYLFLQDLNCRTELGIE